MNGKDAIRASLEISKQWLMPLVMDMKDAPTVFPTPAGGNHPVWVLGHIVSSEQSMLSGFILGESYEPAEQDRLFGMNNQPVADASKYPSIESLAARFETVRARTLKVLDSLSEADLDRASHAPAELADMFGTVGKCFAMLALHATFHAGQVADARRAAGRKPVFA